MAQLVQRPALDLSSGPDLRVVTSRPALGSALGMKPTLKKNVRGAWVAQSVECMTSAQGMISWFVGLSPMSVSVLTAQSLEPASYSVSPSLSATSLLVLSLSQK